MMFVEPLESRIALNAYFVANGGSDSSVGDSAHPWRTLQKAANVALAGDVITVKAGSYAGLDSNRLSGTSSSLIIFRADPGVVVNVANSLGYGISLGQGSKYVRFDNFAVVGTGERGFSIRFAPGCEIVNCRVSKAAWVGIYYAHCPITIRGCESFDNNADLSLTPGHHGIYGSYADSSGSVITGNWIHDNRGNGIHQNGDGGVIRNVTIEDNVIERGGQEGGSAINGDGLSDSVIRRNIGERVGAKGVGLYSIDGGASTGNLIENNVFALSNGRTALQLTSSGNTVRGNVFMNWNSSGNAIESSGTQTWSGNIYKGTLVGVSGTAVGKVWKPGDANFDGFVTGDDYAVTDATLKTDSIFGDMNFDGKVTEADYKIIDANIT